MVEDLSEEVAIAGEKEERVDVAVAMVRDPLEEGAPAATINNEMVDDDSIDRREAEYRRVAIATGGPAGHPTEVVIEVATGKVAPGEATATDP